MRCICGHLALDHRHIDLADTLHADWIGPDDQATEVRVMRSFCERCNCVLYRAGDTLRNPAGSRVTHSGSRVADGES